MHPLALRSFGGELIKQALSAKLVLRALKARAATKGVRVAPKMMRAAEEAAAKGLKQAPASMRRTALGAADSAKGVAKGRQAQRFAERHSRTTGAVKVGPKGKVDTGGLKAKGQQSVKRRVQGAWERALKNPDAVRQKGVHMGTLKQTRVVPGKARSLRDRIDPNTGQVGGGLGDKLVQIKGPKAAVGSDMGATGASRLIHGRLEARPYTQAHIQSVMGKGTAASPILKRDLAQMRAASTPVPAAGGTAATAATGLAKAPPVPAVGVTSVARPVAAAPGATAVARPVARPVAAAPGATAVARPMGTATTQPSRRSVMAQTGRTLSGPAMAYQKTMLPNLPKTMPRVRMGGRVLPAA